MNWFLDRTLTFLIESVPSWQAIVVGGPLSLAWSLACLCFAGHLKQRGTRTGFTRKIFHFLIFGTAALLQWLFGTSAVCLFGAMCSLVVFFAVWCGPSNLLYEAIAREKDEPRRTLFIVTPYFATLIGGLLSNILFDASAIAGYLVTGLGDAIGEPVGTLMGRHSYQAPSLSSVPATRSIEGSLAVFIVSGLSVALATAVSSHLSLPSFGIAKIVIIAATCALAEALSPHGWDNAVMQLLPSAMVCVWMRT